MISEVSLSGVQCFALQDFNMLSFGCVSCVTSVVLAWSLVILASMVVRGNNLSNTTCLTQVFFNTVE